MCRLVAILAFFILTLTTSSIDAASTTYHVNENATGSNDGLSWGDAFTDLSSAFTNAVAGDEIWVAAGTYYTTSSEPSGYSLLDGVSILGGFAGTETSPSQRDLLSNETILNGLIEGGPSRSQRILILQSHNTVDGFTMVGSTGNSIYCSNAISIAIHNCHFKDLNGTNGTIFLSDSDAIINNCRFTNNYSNDVGGAIYCRDSVLKLINSTFGSNISLGSGGALYLLGADVEINFCSFSENQCNNADGGAIYISGNSNLALVGTSFSSNESPENGGAIGITSNGARLDIYECIFISNIASENGGALNLIGPASGKRVFISNSTFQSNSAFNGGAIYDAGELIINRCDFNSNRADHAAGAVYTINSDPTFIANSSFIDNETFSEDGGGLLCVSNNAATVVNTIFKNNRTAKNGGAAASWTALPCFINCTFYNNHAEQYAGGLNLFEQTQKVYNCLIWNNTANLGTPNDHQIAATGADIRYCCITEWTGYWGGIANFGSDPDFIDLDGVDNLQGSLDDDIRLRTTSPLRDFGDSQLLPMDLSDMDYDLDSVEPIPYDFFSNERVFGAAVDIGAYEVFNSQIENVSQDSTPPSLTTNQILLKGTVPAHTTSVLVDGEEALIQGSSDWSKVIDISGPTMDLDLPISVISPNGIRHSTISIKSK